MNTDLIKAASSLVVSAGIGAVVTNAIKATTPEDIKPIAKIAVVVGTFVASRAISDTATNYSAKQIDELSSAYKKAKEAMKSKKND